MKIDDRAMKYTQKQIDDYRRIWLEQLRHPDAEQWTGELESYHEPNKRCCLGHACHVLQTERSEVHSLHEVYYGSGQDKDSNTLPYSVAEKLNIMNSGAMINAYVHGNDVYGGINNIE